MSIEGGNSLKAKIARDEFVLGSWVTLGHPAIAEIMARSGFDWITIDLEHSVITIREAEDLIRVLTLANVPALVRLTSNDTNQVKRVMDAGASGIIVPMVTCREDAVKAVDAVKYPPVGKRGVGLARAQQYGAGFDKYRTWLDQDSVIIVQIEHIDAITNLEDIFSVENIDGYIIGPYDLSASMGIPGQFSHPDFNDAMEHIKSTSKRMGIPGGIHIIEPDPSQLEVRVKEGFKFIAYSLDIRMLDVTCRHGVDFFLKWKK